MPWIVRITVLRIATNFEIHICNILILYNIELVIYIGDADLSLFYLEPLKAHVHRISSSYKKRGKGGLK